MDAAAVLSAKSQLADLKHEGALNAVQFQLLKSVVKDGLVTDQVLDNFRLAWKLRCSGAVDKDEYEEDLQMIMGEMESRGGDSGAAETVGGKQGCLVPTGSMPASSDKGKGSALVAQIADTGIMSSFAEDSGSGRPRAAGCPRKARRLSDGSRQYSSGSAAESVVTEMGEEEEEEIHDENEQGRRGKGKGKRKARSNISGNSTEKEEEEEEEEEEDRGGGGEEEKQEEQKEQEEESGGASSSKGKSSNKGAGAGAANKEASWPGRLRRRRLPVQSESGPVQAEPGPVQADPGPVQADPGVILNISLHNFMSHKSFDLKLCKGVNIINGRNGSGKSAILDAIQICLAEDAKDTHRDKKLSDFIRRGWDGDAVVQVTLHNNSEGHDFDEYGSSITVRRTIKQSGGSEFTLIGHDGQVKSEDEDELADMLDALRIEVGCPAMVQHKETCKKFLQGSDHDKYEFFMSVHSLDRLLHSYSATNDEIMKLRHGHHRALEQLLSVRSSLVSLRRDFEDCVSLDKLPLKIERLKGELGWAVVDDLEKKVAGHGESVAFKDREITKIKTTIIELEDVLADINEEVEERQVRIYKEMVSRNKNPNIADLFQEEGMGEAKLYYDLRKAKARLAEAEQELKDLSAEREEADAKRKTALGITEKYMIRVRRRDGLEWDGTRVSTRWNQEQIRQRIKVASETLDRNRQRIESRGKSQEEVMKETEHVLKAHKEKEAIVSRLEKTMVLLSKAMRQRMVRYLTIRRCSASSTYRHFYYYLQQKDAIGEIIFDHDRQYLRLKYQKDSSDPDNVCSDLMLLPEEERSFVNLAALLTFGGSHCSCFRVMDGFDNSTSAKIRNAALMQVIDYAGVFSSSQFILVTDQDLSSATISHKCRIHKMRPRRIGDGDQATLCDTVGGDVS